MRLCAPAINRRLTAKGQQRPSSTAMQKDILCQLDPSQQSFLEFQKISWAARWWSMTVWTGYRQYDNLDISPGMAQSWLAMLRFSQIKLDADLLQVEPSKTEMDVLMQDSSILLSFVSTGLAHWSQTLSGMPQKRMISLTALISPEQNNPGLGLQIESQCVGGGPCAAERRSAVEPESPQVDWCCLLAVALKPD